ncbi:TRAP transporter substrate-binding protein [Algiphilus sp.]|uniref:TRAP transporter substrate-binding protein n=1 Tax=Algiphilus sp. TaxID=1872431 RepID=UPI002A67FF20|nr:TRAP transporter substrate-binding protein [Pseudomonadota bacterium]
MQRRDLIVGGLAAGAGLAGCSPASQEAAPAASKQRASFRWTMYTTWPRNFPGLGSGAARLAETINTMSEGRLQVEVFGAGERVPAMEVFDAVSRGSAQMGHGAAYYWKGKSPAMPFFTALPFGMTADEMTAWLHWGGGMALWRELYHDFNLVPFDAGNTSAQMGGWFNKRINAVEDLDGLRMRIPGLGGDVMARLGVATVNIPGGELYQALSTGAIDAAEWVGPYNDLAFGFQKIAKYYYYPGWQEPGATLEAIVNKDAWDALPEDLQAIVDTACKAASHTMRAEINARNAEALRELREEHDVEILRFPDAVLDALHAKAGEVVEALAERDPFARKVWDAYRPFLQSIAESTRLNDSAQLGRRRLGT